MRIAGVTIPDTKQLLYALPLIYGIGPARARDILKEAKIAENKKGSELSTDEEQKIRTLAERGTRHARRLPARGQRTKTNSRTVRGNTRKTMGSGRRSLEKT
jgi:small subunit ribosomal protein S13